MNDLVLILGYARRDADVEAVTFRKYTPETGCDGASLLMPQQQSELDAWYAANPDARWWEYQAKLGELINQKGNGDGTTD